MKEPRYCQDCKRTVTPKPADDAAILLLFILGLLTLIFVIGFFFIVAAIIVYYQGQSNRKQDTCPICNGRNLAELPRPEEPK